MCLILFAWRAHPEHVLVVAANRDEYFERPASAADYWPDVPHILAGRDLSANGTSLGVTRNGRFASITNYRNPAERRPTAPSRGQLVADFLSGTDAPGAHFERVAPHAMQFNGYSMLACDGHEMACYSNREGMVRKVEAGVHGLSNHLLDTPWPKVLKGKEELGGLLTRRFDPEAYLAMLGDSEPAHDRHLPDTGVGIERERQLSSIRILDGYYGTRCSSLFRLDRDGTAEFWERSYASDGATSGTVHYRFTVTPPDRS